MITDISWQTLQQYSQLLLAFLVVLARVGGLVTFAPFWNIAAVSTMIRILLAVALSIIVTIFVYPDLPVLPSDLFPLVLMLMTELALGCLFGFIGRLVMSALEMASHLLTAQLGFTLAATIDPSSKAQTTAFNSFANMFGLVILLGMNGHHWFLTALIRSFSQLRPGAFVMTYQLTELLIVVSAQALNLGVALAAPAIIILFVVDFLVGLAGRIIPQLQLLLIDFPLKAIIGFCLISSLLYSLPSALRHVFSFIRLYLLEALRLLG